MRSSCAGSAASVTPMSAFASRFRGPVGREPLADLKGYYTYVSNCLAFQLTQRPLSVQKRKARIRWSVCRTRSKPVTVLASRGNRRFTGWSSVTIPSLNAPMTTITSSATGTGGRSSVRWRAGFSVVGISTLDLPASAATTAVMRCSCRSLANNDVSAPVAIRSGRCWPPTR